jgi:hypothetical protein
MSTSSFCLTDGACGFLAWTYDDGLFQEPYLAVWRPSDDVPDDSESWPKDTAEEEQQTEEEQNEPPIPPLEGPPPAEPVPPLPLEPLVRFYGESVPFTALGRLPPPELHGMAHPKDKLRPLPRPSIEAPEMRTTSY